ncbi:hypothetical protein [Sphingomonas sp.]|uniref:hypothetical protein n=1 Tax=Sphingomonas sp. TaxID=28214 RepID=UPI0035C863C9
MFYSGIDVAAARPIAPARVRPAMLAALAICIAALVLRFAQFGNALAGLDEQFYLLVGERMWAGELPYVDLWDRKPVGLFALFAGIAALPLDGVLAAQLVATGFAAATAMLVAAIAGRWTGWPPATMTGIFYLAGLNELWGETTQTPVFYNGLVAGAALLTLRGRGAAAMALIGLAIQIKTNAVFQGAFLGVWLLAAEWRRGGPVVRTALLYSLLGIAPTLLAFGAYAAIGQGAAWWQANVLSILAKGTPRDAAAVRSFWESWFLFLPATVLALIGLRRWTRRFTLLPDGVRFTLGWMAVSAIDFAAIGGFYPHYAIPLLLACTPAVAQAFAIRRWGPALFAVTLAWPLFHATVANPRVAAKERGYAAQVASAIPDAVRERCLFVYEGPVAYYRLSHACHLSRYVFTAHLSSGREAASLGVDPATELDRIMARRPAAVITVAHSTWPDRNPAMERRLARWLARDYRVSARLPHRAYSAEERLLVWQRREASEASSSK